MLNALISVPSFLVQRSYDYGTYSYSTSGGDAAAAGVSAVILVVYCAILCIVPAAWAGICYFLVYKDAKKWGVENAMLWTLLSFFVTPIGIILYYLVPRKDAKEKASKTSSAS